MINKAKIDPIGSIMSARNGATAALLSTYEYQKMNSEIVIALENTIEHINLIHRWFMRNPNALEVKNHSGGESLYGSNADNS